METDTDTGTLPREVTIGGRTITLQPPSSLTVCREVMVAAASNHFRACYASLGLCWRMETTKQRSQLVALAMLEDDASKGALLRPLTSYLGCDYNPLRFGGEFCDALTASGVDHGEILAAGLQAWLLIADQLPSADDEDAASGN